MNELTDEQIESIYLDHRDQLPNIPLIRAIITADRAQRQADLSAWQNSPTIDNADAIRAQRQAVQEPCRSQTLESAPQTSLSRTDATQAVERAHGISSVPARQLAVECDECGATHRPGENTLCPTFRPQQIAEPAVAIGWKLVPLEPTAEMLQAGQDAPVSESDEDAPEDYKAVYRAMLAAAPQPAQADKDAERLDWLDQNIFSRENINFMGQLDPTMNMWVTFSPKGHQGSARNILDAAMQAQAVKS